ncbi:MAG TPA: amidohydrolase family protein [Candidatus Heimdallarchaeota archaeon]|nr:amidohydrolase family protein [Candidatus Heimdallarchaeota archaeon]
MKRLRSLIDFRAWNYMQVLLRYGIFILALFIAPLSGWTEGSGSHTEDLPLKPTRTLNFTTDEGTWISTDVSPDGLTLVFDLLGDLYVLPIEGGVAKALSRGMAFDTQPRFSPDGHHIAFVSDRDGSENVWIMKTDGSSAAPLTSGKDTVYISPEWTPDGEAIIAAKTGVVRNSLMELWLYSIADRKGVCLVNGEKNGLTALGPAFGADPRSLCFSQKAESLQTYHPQIGEYQLAVYDRQTKEIYPYSNAQGGGMRPVLSTDGHWLVYASRFHADTGLRLRDLYSGEEKWLLYPVQLDVQGAQHASWDLMPGSSFTPDSKFLITTIEGKIWKVSVPDGKRALIPFTVRVEQPMGPPVHSELRVDDSPVQARRISEPKISPDGKKVVFSALGRLWLMGLPDGILRRLTDSDTGEFQSSWSPDGQFIVYATWKNMKEAGHLYRIRASKEGRPERLTENAAYYGCPTYSPDGDRIIFVSMSRQAWIEDLLSYGSDMSPRAGPRVQLGWIPAEGGDIRRITFLHDLGRPHFIKPDRERVFIYQQPARATSPRGGLVSVRLDGSDLRSHLKATVFDEKWPVDQVLMAPAGDGVLIQADRHIYLADLPKQLKEPLTLSVSSPDPTYIVRKISTVGGEFAGWSRDGNKICFSLGTSLFQYDLSSDTLKETKVRIEMPRYVPEGTVVLKGGRAITMRGDEILQSCDLVIEGNRIVGLGSRGTVAVPPGAHIIDVSGKTILPGFIDVHNHQGTTQETRIIQPWEFISSLAYGVTTGYDTGAAGPSLVTYADMVETGQLVGPRFYGAGALILPAMGEKLENLADARDLVQRYYDYYGLDGVKEYSFGGRRKRQLLAMAAKEFGLAIHAEGNGETKPGVTEIIDGYTTHQHYFTFIPLYRDMVELIAQSGVGYVPTLLITHGAQGAEDFYYAEGPVQDDPKLRLFTPHPFLDRETRRREEPWQRWMVKEEYVFPRLAKSAGDVIAAGGKVGVGAHGQRQGIGFHWEMWSLATGMSNHEVLRAATLLGAEISGLDRDLGTIDIGKLADLVVLDKDPLEDIRNTNSICYVIKNGVVYEGDTLTEIWPKHRERSWLEGWYTDPQK